MICEKCAGETDTLICPHCDADIVKLGPYCYRCGRALSEETGETNEGGEFDLSTRILCSDDACIGVVDENGVCKVCGKRYEPESPK
jgi:hypothetical protein